MRNILNIFIFYFIVSLMNIWSVGIAAPNDILWAAAAEIVESEEKEKEEDVKNNILDQDKLKQRGQGGGSKYENYIVVAEPQIIIPFYSTRVLPEINEHQSLKKHNRELTNSLAIPKLYILFRCPKTFLA